MYYLLRDSKGEAFCTIIVPEATEEQEDIKVTLIEDESVFYQGNCVRFYKIRKNYIQTRFLSEDVGSVIIDWQETNKIPSVKYNDGTEIRCKKFPLERISKAQFETYTLFELPCITREDSNPFNKLALIDV